MEKSENAKSKRTNSVIIGNVIIVVAVVLFTVISIGFSLDSFHKENESRMQQYETQIKSLIAKYDSLRSLDMAMIAKLSEKKPVVLFIPKYTPTVKIDESYVRDKMGDWIWYNREPETLCQFVANVDNMKWLGFGATNLSNATKITGSKLAKKSDNTQLFYIMCYVALLL